MQSCSTTTTIIITVILLACVGQDSRPHLASLAAIQTPHHHRARRIPVNAQELLGEALKNN